MTPDRVLTDEQMTRPVVTPEMVRDAWDHAIEEAAGRSTIEGKPLSARQLDTAIIEIVSDRFTAILAAAPVGEDMARETIVRVRSRRWPLKQDQWMSPEDAEAWGTLTAEDHFHDAPYTLTEFAARGEARPSNPSTENDQ